jgi:hypothetical protein
MRTVFPAVMHPISTGIPRESPMNSRRFTQRWKRKGKDYASSLKIRRCQPSQPFVLLESVDDGTTRDVKRRSK